MTNDLLYLDDSNLTELDVIIKKMDGCHVEFKKTIIYPGGGGQPMDKAKIVQGDKEFSVVSAKPQGDNIIYTLDGSLSSRQPVTQKIDKFDRKQKQQYHTLLHLIAALAGKNYDCKVTSSEILQDHARIELAFPSINQKSDFNKEEFWQDILNFLKENHSVTTRTIERKNIDNENQKVRTIVSLIPSQITVVRFVKIEGIDDEACAGTHVSNTNEISKNLIFTVKSKGSQRIRIKIQLIE